MSRPVPILYRPQTKTRLEQTTTIVAWSTLLTGTKIDRWFFQWSLSSCWYCTLSYFFCRRRQTPERIAGSPSPLLFLLVVYKIKSSSAWVLIKFCSTRTWVEAVENHRQNLPASQLPGSLISRRCSSLFTTGKFARDNKKTSTRKKNLRSVCNVDLIGESSNWSYLTVTTQRWIQSWCSDTVQTEKEKLSWDWVENLQIPRGRRFRFAPHPLPRPCPCPSILAPLRRIHPNI